jgi:hypothetical protein
MERSNFDAVASYFSDKGYKNNSRFTYYTQNILKTNVKVLLNTSRLYHFKGFDRVILGIH